MSLSKNHPPTLAGVKSNRMPKKGFSTELFLEYRADLILTCQGFYLLVLTVPSIFTFSEI